MPYVIEHVTDLTVLSTTTLTIQDGVVIKMKPGTSFTVEGTLLAQGTNTNPITFTSLLDCSATPCPGYWKWLYFTPSSTGSILENTNVSFGGGNTGSIRIEESSVQIDNVTSQYSSEAGLYLQNSTSSVQNSHFANNQFGMKVYGLAYPQLLEGTTFENNVLKDIFIDDTNKCSNVLRSYAGNTNTNCP